jgi:hypothetical protein
MKSDSTQFGVRENPTLPEEHDSRLEKRIRSRPDFFDNSVSNEKSATRHSGENTTQQRTVMPVASRMAASAS